MEIQRVYNTKYSPKKTEVKSRTTVAEYFGVIESTTSMSTHNLMRYYKTIAPVKAAMDQLCRAVSSIPIMLSNVKTNEQVETHAVLKLLKKPNIAYQKTMKSLFRDITFWKALSGDVFLIVTGRTNPLEIYVVRSTDVQVYVDSQTGRISKYDYRSQNTMVTETYTPDLYGRYFSPDGLREMLHLSNIVLEPDSSDQGSISDIAALHTEILQYKYATEHNVNLLSNGATPSGAIVVPAEAGSLDEKTFSDLQAQINSQMRGASNAGRTLILEGGLDWKDMSVKSKDGNFDNIKDGAEAQIYKALGVPLDLASGGKSVSANNMVNIRREFYHNRVVPFTEEILEFFNSFILPRYSNSDNLELRIDLDAIDVFTEDRAKQRAVIENSTTLTLNRKLKTLKEAQMSTEEGGDAIYDPNGRYIAGKPGKYAVGGTPFNSGVEQPPKVV